MLCFECGELEGVVDLGIEGGVDKVEFGDYMICLVWVDMCCSVVDVYIYFVYLNGWMSFWMSYNSDVYLDEIFVVFM